MKLLLLDVAGCTTMDVISILRKKRQEVTGRRVEARGSQADEHSEGRYSPAISTVRGTTEIRNRYEILEEG